MLEQVTKNYGYYLLRKVLLLWKIGVVAKEIFSIFNE